MNFISQKIEIYYNIYQLVQIYYNTNKFGEKCKFCKQVYK